VSRYRLSVIRLLLEVHAMGLGSVCLHIKLHRLWSCLSVSESESKHAKSILKQRPKYSQRVELNITCTHVFS